jgi:hypothetical protein
MSVTGNDATAFFACLGKKVQFAMPDPCLRGICRATSLLENYHVASLAQDHAAKWFYLPENTLNFEQCLFQLHAYAACARPTR